MTWFVRTGGYADYVRKHRSPEYAEEDARQYTPGDPKAFPQHHPGDEWPNVGWVETDLLHRYREHSGDQHQNSQEEIEHLTDSFRNGEGFIDPLRLYYNPEAGRAFLGEGNHRLQAAMRAGLTHVPVMVHTYSDPNRGKLVDFERKLQPRSYGGYSEQIHPGNVLPLDWLHPADLIPKLQERGVPEEEWPQNVRDWHNRPKTTPGPLISESSISEGSVRPFFVRQADAGRPKFDQPSAQDRANKAWGMDGKDQVLNMPFYSPMTDMTDDEVAAEFGVNSSGDKFDRQAAKPLVSPQTWGGPKTLQEMDPQTLEAYRKWQADVKDYTGRFMKQYPASPKNVIEHFENATPQEVQEGMDWYQKANLVAKSIANNTEISVPQAAGLLAIYSPQTDWYNNMMRASRVAQSGKGIGGEGSGIMASDAQRKAADRVLAGEDYHNVVKGPKIRAFADLIATGGDPDPDNPLVVVDRHAVGVTHGQFANDYIYNASGTGVRNYRNRTADYVNAAKALAKKGVQITPHQLQAATWLVRQRRNVESGYVDPGRAAARIRMTENAKKQWEDFAAKHHPDLLGDAAPIVGFENAQRIAFFVRRADKSGYESADMWDIDQDHDEAYRPLDVETDAFVYPNGYEPNYAWEVKHQPGFENSLVIDEPSQGVWPNLSGSGVADTQEAAMQAAEKHWINSHEKGWFPVRVPFPASNYSLSSRTKPYFVRREA